MKQTLLGYVAVHVEGDAYIGGLLVVDNNGDPVDFTYTDPVTLTWPTRVLFGPRLPAYIATRILAPPLLKAATVKPTVVCFDDGTVLARQCALDVPAAVVAAASSEAMGAQRWQMLDFSSSNGSGDGVWWGQADAADQVKEALTAAWESRTFTETIEPFDRLRQALRDVPSGPGR